MSRARGPVVSSRRWTRCRDPRPPEKRVVAARSGPVLDRPLRARWSGWTAPRGRAAARVVLGLAVSAGGRGLDDGHVADGGPHDLAWHRAQHLALGGPQTAVAHHDEGGRIPAGYLQQSLGWPPGDDHLLDVSDAVGGQFDH